MVYDLSIKNYFLSTKNSKIPMLCLSILCSKRKQKEGLIGKLKFKI